ncbi:DUF1513 domain-containing protein [Paracoccus sediminilitoris]|uniref:DUF1513 domain-containing protein n=1 Tax=Paracoccus sediminilitoris TaxID=2202419 RepID=UPI000DB90DCB|nr:DUF1513 domain-containing protein [Paracoccus sediminilitoris]
MCNRRGFLAGIAATGAMISGASWANLGNPAFLAAARDARGRFTLCELTAKAQIAFRVDLPDRGHPAARPTRAEAEAVAFARSPGTFELVMECAVERVVQRMQVPQGWHFYGYGAYLQDGEVLVTTENDHATGAAALGIWDARCNYARIVEIPTCGIGSHEVIRLPGTQTELVANCRIRIHPDSDRDRDKLNLDNMHPSLVCIDDGHITQSVTLAPELAQASIHHISARSDATVVAALRSEGDPEQVMPLLKLR